MQLLRKPVGNVTRNIPNYGLNVSRFTVKDRIQMFQEFARKILLNELVNVMKVLLVLPATNAISPRLFQSFIKRRVSFTAFCACANFVNINISANALWQSPLKSYDFK